MTKAEERYERIETLKSGNGENSGRIRPKANNIRVNFIAGVTALTFNEACRPPKIRNLLSGYRFMLISSCSTSLLVVMTFALA